MKNVPVSKILLGCALSSMTGSVYAQEIQPELDIEKVSLSLHQLEASLRSNLDVSTPTGASLNLSERSQLLNDVSALKEKLGIPPLILKNGSWSPANW